ncbi:hypothetical protein DFJ77DRAFT_268269 [Powellomyces hirtus]|nr:hypothetical protein DFJ77DRAFT_268269 [Powellomyces hirtus]
MWVTLTVVRILRTTSVSFACCATCMLKLEKVARSNAMECLRCHRLYNESEVPRRFRIQLIGQCGPQRKKVTIFGDNLDAVFGTDAKTFESLLATSEQLSMSAVLDGVAHALVGTRVALSIPVRHMQSDPLVSTFWPMLGMKAAVLRFFQTLSASTIPSHSPKAKSRLIADATSSFEILHTTVRDSNALSTHWLGADTPFLFEDITADQFWEDAWSMPTSQMDTSQKIMDKPKSALDVNLPKAADDAGHNDKAFEDSLSELLRGLILDDESDWEKLEDDPQTNANQDAASSDTNSEDTSESYDYDEADLIESLDGLLLHENIAIGRVTVPDHHTIVR